MTTRRAFIGTLAGGFLATPLISHSQATGPVRRIGVLSTGGPSASAMEPFEQGLRDAGYVEGRNILIERRSPRGSTGDLPSLAADLVRLRVEVIVALDPPATRAARRATQTIPIVMRVSSDPVEDGLVSSLARPGGNLTGLYSLYELLASKRLELLHQAIPGLKQVAVLWDPANRSSLVGWSETERAARSLGVGLQSVEVAEGAPLEPAFRSAKGSHSGALLTLRNPRIVRERSEVLRLAARHRLPAIYDERALVEAGGLMSYGASLTDLHRRAASYVDKILRGAKPADLPVEQPTKFELVINLKTANALGLTIPPSLLVRADELTQ